MPEPPVATSDDAKRWLALVVLSTSVFFIVLDATVLTVAIPTIIRDLHTDVTALQWVVAGYALVFASLLISLGRLGDVVGRRRMFIVGTALFGAGSFVASVSATPVQLFVGEALLEGVGAAAMMPATLAIVSSTFRGRERGKAFAVWGAVAGGAGALGPWIGGILTTDHSWRWSFRINVILAPIVIVATIAVVKESRDESARGFDPIGVALVTTGLLALVFGIIEAARFGWITPTGDMTLLGLSPVPWALLVAATLLGSFVAVESRRTVASKPVVFDFGDLVHKGFRYGLVNTAVLAMGEFGAFFIIPIFLQSARGLSAIETGRWLLPAGAGVFVGGAISGVWSQRHGPKYAITAGLALEAVGIWWYVARFSATTTFGDLLPGLVLHGMGIGCATSQLTNVVLSDIPPQKAGSASGASGMVRQVGTALGISLIGAIYMTRLSDGTVEDPVAIASAAKPAVGFAGGVVVVGALVSLLVPNIPPDGEVPVCVEGEWATVPRGGLIAPAPPSPE